MKYLKEILNSSNFIGFVFFSTKNVLTRKIAQEFTQRQTGYPIKMHGKRPTFSLEKEAQP